MVFGSNAVSFLNYLYHLIMGRMLGPTGYGELASILSLSGLLGIIPGSLNLVIIKFVSTAKNENEKENLIGFLKAKIFQISIFFCLIFLLASPFLSSFLNIDEPYFLILIASSFLFSIQSSLNRSILQGLLKFKEMVISVMVENSAKLLLGIILLYMGFKVGGVLFAFVTAAILGFFFTNLFLRGKPSKAIKSLPDLKDILKFALPVGLQTIATTSLYSTDLILVKHFFSSYEAGIYAALSTLGKIIFFGAGPISSVMFPLVSQRQAKGENFKKIFIYSFIATTFFALSILTVYWIFPEIALRLLYGSAYLEFSKLLVWFGVYITLFTLSALLINYSLSLGRTKVVFFPTIAAILQIILISLFHGNIFEVVFISGVVNTLLLSFLLIYSIYGNKITISNRARL